MKIKFIEGKGIRLNTSQVIDIYNMNTGQLNAFLTNIYQGGIKCGKEKARIEQEKKTIKEKERARNAFIYALGVVKGIGEEKKQELRLSYREHINNTEEDHAKS